MPFTQKKNHHINQYLLLLAALQLLISCSHRSLIRLPSPDHSDHAAKMTGESGISGSISAPEPENSMEPGVSVEPTHVPAGLTERMQAWTLTDVLDIALQNNTSTRAAWADAKAAAAKYKSQRGDYFPDISLDASASRIKSMALPGRTSEPTSMLGVSASIIYLLLDFGGRSAVIENMNHAMTASELTSNAVVLDVILQVEIAYFRYMTTLAMLDAERMNLKEAETNLESARNRHQVGLAVIADILQAQTRLSKSQLALQKTEGDLHTARGALALSMGLPANTQIELQQITPSPSVDMIKQTVEQLIASAMENRPDLKAAQEKVRSLECRVRELRSQDRPSLRLTGSVGRTYFPSDSSDSDSYAAGISLSFPLFTGFSNTYNILQAEKQHEAEIERARALEQRIIYQVFTAYYSLQTSIQQVATAQALVESATQNETTALARYKEGVGSIIDLMSAQTLLADARAEQIQAQWGWQTALIQLAHDTALLGLRGENPLFNPVQPK